VPAELTVRDSTIAYNIGVGIVDRGLVEPFPIQMDLDPSGVAVAYNLGGNCSAKQDNSTGSQTNLFSDGGCWWGSSWMDIIMTDPLLLPLADNGGPTPTHALTPGSPAIDAGGDECLQTDQREVIRPQDGDGDGIAKCDIGAYEADVLSVVIDIKPDGYPNSINPYARGVIPVALLGSDTFDIADIDVSTLAFGPSGASIAHMHGHLQDVNLDGFMDLVTHYRTQDTGIVCGDESATLTGETLDGQPLEGSDSINTVGCRASRWPAIWMKDQDRSDTGRHDGPVNIERK